MQSVWFKVCLQSVEVVRAAVSVTPCKIKVAVGARLLREIGRGSDCYSVSSGDYIALISFSLKKEQNITEKSLLYR